MKSLLLLALSATAMVRGGEPEALTIRQKLHARILESAPPAPPPKPASEQKAEEKPAEAPIVMKPVVVLESKRIEAVTAALARQEQDRRDEKFTALDGGKIVSIGGLEFGSWWAPGEGWTFLRTDKAPTGRQREATAARMKELMDLAKSVGKR